MPNIRADIKIILETAYGAPVQTSVLNELENLVERIVLQAKQDAQDEQARAMFGAMSVDGDVSDA